MSLVAASSTWHSLTSLNVLEAGSVEDTYINELGGIIIVGLWVEELDISDCFIGDVGAECDFPTEIGWLTGDEYSDLLTFVRHVCKLH